MKTLKVRLYPTTEQKKVISQWFHTARWTYNNAVKYISDLYEESKKTKKKYFPKLQQLRNLFTNADVLDKHKWVKDTPYDIRDEALRDLLKAYKSNFAKTDNNGFSIKFKSRKAKSDSITINKKHWKCGKLFPTFLKDKIKTAERVHNSLPHDSRLVKTNNGEYYICIPIECENQTLIGVNKVISIDPGVRTFCTGYDPSGRIIEWGKGDFDKIHNLCRLYSKLQSRLSQKTVRHRQRRNLQRVGRRIQNRIHNLVDEIHKKLVKYLCMNYEYIILPPFETSKMVKKQDRKISNKTAKAMLTWSHYRFRMRLIHKAREYGNKILIHDESYTSMTCSECGLINRKLGSSKLFICKDCGNNSDRDFNAARNILLKYFSDSK